MRVVFVVLDSLPNARVGSELTPNLWSLIRTGGWHPDGGVAVLASSTYPNHATFATGVDVAGHRIFTNDIWDGAAFRCSSNIGPVGDTIFDAARRASRSSAAITGDITMVGCMGAERADIHWPTAEGPENVATDCLGYTANEEVIATLAASGALETDLVFVHMNDPDSTLHRYGPDSDVTIDTIRRVDRELGEIVDLIRSNWDDTVLFVVSDHEQETVNPRLEPLDIGALLSDAGLAGHGHNEGTVGIVYDSDGATRLRGLPGIAGARDLDVGSDGRAITLVWGTQGQVFGASNKGAAGQHGSPRTRTQVASVSGGHPVVADLAVRMRSGFGSRDGRPHATHYAHVMAGLLGFSLGL